MRLGLISIVEFYNQKQLPPGCITQYMYIFIQSGSFSLNGTNIVCEFNKVTEANICPFTCL